jgi:hypothetical protein
MGTARVWRAAVVASLLLAGCGGQEQATADLKCDPSYAGACLNPNATDYDCEDGSGDGPKYTGAVEVVGDDHFELDRDGDGSTCEW